MGFSLAEGTSPVILCFPHSGTDVPDDVAGRLNDNGRILADTDWHLDQLYAGLLPGASVLKAHIHRYVIDVNRDPSGTSLYPGQNTTSLVPLTDFDGNAIWQAGAEPTPADIAARLAAHHRPYHHALRGEIERLRAQHGAVLVYDCHSIRGTIPFLFEGRLPDLNIGTDDGRSCAPRLEAAAVAAASAANGYSWVLNGRFKGGWTTRAHADPARGIHTIQMELAQATHLASETPPFAYDANRAPHLRAQLRHLLRTLERLVETL